MPAWRGAVPCERLFQQPLLIGAQVTDLPHLVKPIRSRNRGMGILSPYFSKWFPYVKFTYEPAEETNRCVFESSLVSAFLPWPILLAP
jgi:hypothetical protein